MLNRRLIPKLLLKSVRLGHTDRMVLVTTRQFQKIIQIGDPISQAKIYEAQAADELIFLDIDATLQNRPPHLDIVQQAAQHIFMPITVGGGVRSLADFRNLLSHGADKVSLNTAAVLSPDLINAAAAAFGTQCVVVSIDFKHHPDGHYSVFTQAGRVDSHLDPVRWARQAQSRGAGEILLTSIDRDGTEHGLDLQLTKAVAESVSIPVIASGGCSRAQHFIDGFQIANADAVAAGTFFCFKDQNPMQTRAHIRNAGVPIRLHR